MVSAPIAVFLTWWGDCLEDACPSARASIEAAYAFDFAWWLAFPVLAFFAYRGWRPAAIGLLVIAVVLDLQVVAAIRRRSRLLVVRADTAGRRAARRSAGVSASAMRPGVRRPADALRDRRARPRSAGPGDRRRGDRAAGGPRRRRRRRPGTAVVMAVSLFVIASRPTRTATVAARPPPPGPPRSGADGHSRARRRPLHSRPCAGSARRPSRSPSPSSAR